MSRYLERNMQRDEKLVYAASLHWIVYLRGFLTTMLGAVLGHGGGPLLGTLLGETVSGLLGKPISYIGAGIVVIGAMQLIYAYVYQISTELVISDQRVIAKHGLLSTTTYELMLMKVEGANIDQTVAGRILGYGTVMVKGTGGGISPIDHVAKPYAFHARLMETIQRLQEGETPSLHGND